MHFRPQIKFLTNCCIDFWASSKHELLSFAGMPLFSCPDKVELMDGVNDMTVKCRVVSVRYPLTAVRIRIYEDDGKNFTIDGELLERAPSDTVYSDDNRYVLRVEPFPTTVRTYTDFNILLASCLINAQPLSAHSPATDNNSLIGCTSHELTR